MKRSTFRLHLGQAACKYGPCTFPTKQQAEISNLIQKVRFPAFRGQMQRMKQLLNVLGIIPI